MSRPEKGTPEWELWVAAIDIAAYPALSHDAATVFAAKVPWSRIERLRAALEDVGIDWRKVHDAEQDRDVAAGRRARRT